MRTEMDVLAAMFNKNREQENTINILPENELPPEQTPSDWDAGFRVGRFKGFLRGVIFMTAALIAVKAYFFFT